MKIGIKKYIQYEQNEDIEPWRQQSSKIPSRFLKASQLPPKTKEESKEKLEQFLRFYKTEQSIRRTKFKKTENQKSENSLPVSNPNPGLQCFNLSWTEANAMPSNLKLHLSNTRVKDETVFFARKRAKQGLQIKSIKKRLVDSQLIQQKTRAEISSADLNFSRAVTFKTRFITQSKFQQGIKDIGSQPLLSPVAKKIELKTKHKAVNQNFVAEIAAIMKEKCKMLEERRSKRKTEAVKDQNPENMDEKNSITTDLTMERQLFQRKNNKFKSWQTHSRKLVASSVILSHRRL